MSISGGFQDGVSSPFSLPVFMGDAGMWGDGGYPGAGMLQSWNSFSAGRRVLGSGRAGVS